ncbi:hypothetical protein DPMN_032110 [Dreissena polymorpha]|uniref:Apple domain-containing protein n=1 Tax=Dreissena polymorpha TaxID=45954 RepID=A0A9D4M185_DREPO|nr:hypothetical protein DPMN_032110 [Dreissena polymorpha]
MHVLLITYIAVCVLDFSVFTDIAMINPPVITVFKVVSDIVCATICLRQTEPECMTAQFDQATHICTLFNGYKHTKDSSNANKTAVCKWDAHFFANNN